MLVSEFRNILIVGFFGYKMFRCSLILGFLKFIILVIDYLWDYLLFRYFICICLFKIVFFYLLFYIYFINEEILYK